MNDLSVVAQEFYRRNLERAASTYAKSCDKGSVESFRAPPPGAHVCEHDMFTAVLRGLGQILTMDLERRMEPPKVDPRDL